MTQIAPRRHRGVVVTSARTPFSTVLVATDFSAGSTAALDRVLALPLAADARIDLVHVSECIGKLRAKVEAAAHEALAQVVARARSRLAGAEITSTVMRGEPFVEIIRRARRIDADLIVLGRHGKRRLRGLVLGTTAARVVRMGEGPTLIVQGARTASYRAPLVATDLGDASRPLVELALRLVDSRAMVSVVHAVHIPFEGFLASTELARSRIRRPVEADATAKVVRLVAPYKKQHGRWRAHVATGDARTIVVNEATRCRADVIVVGTHGRSGLARTLIGSVAEWVIANAPCDVLVARTSRFTFEVP
jgi:nucleotide-binding universal stress UspA family protein